MEPAADWAARWKQAYDNYDEIYDGNIIKIKKENKKMKLLLVQVQMIEKYQTKIFNEANFKEKFLKIDKSSPHENP